MWMLYTFAAHFSGDPELQELVPEFMKKARSNLEQSLAKSDRLFKYAPRQFFYNPLRLIVGFM